MGRSPFIQYIRIVLLEIRFLKMASFASFGRMHIRHAKLTMMSLDTPPLESVTVAKCFQSSQNTMPKDN